MESDGKEFFDKVDAHSGAVYLVHVYVDGEVDKTGIFSTKKLTEKWLESQDGTVVICPYVVDCPDFGNVPKKELC